MRKLSVLVFALVAMLAVGGIAANAAKKEKVKSKVTLNFKSGPAGGGDPYYEEAVFRGKVKAKGRASKKARRKCKRGRTVVVKHVGGGRFGQDRTNRRGKYVMSASGAYNEPGRYRATVRRKKKGKIVCKKATSRAVRAF